MYGLLIILGVLVAAFIAEYLAKKQGLNIDILWDGLLVILVFGLVGARTFHVLEFWDYYSMEPGSIPLLWKGGLNIIGGLMLALPSIILFLKIKNAPILEWLDIVALVLPLAQFIGRWGNYFNQELLPYAYFEMVLNILLFCTLWFVYKYKSLNGVVVQTYLLAYALIRFSLEDSRPFHTNIYGINLTQGLSLIVIIAILLFNALYYFRSCRIQTQK